MLRDDRQVALNDVVLACKSAAGGYADAADLIDDPGLEALFRALAGERRDAADRLAPHVRRLGDLPQEPDADSATMRRLVSRVRASLSADERSALLRERESAEEAVARAVAAALDQDLPEDTKVALRQLAAQVSQAAQRLAAARTSV